MTLRKKTLIFSAVVFACLIACLLALSLFITKEAFTGVEDKEIRQDVVRALNIIENDMAVLGGIAREFAASDAVCSFMQTGSKAFIRENLLESSFSKFQVNFVLFVDASGKIVFGKSYNLKKGGELPFPKALQEKLSTDKILFDNKNMDNEVTGVMMLPDGPMLVAALPIISSEMTGAPCSRLIMASRLDYFKIRQFAKMAKLSLVVHAVDDRYMPVDKLEAVPYLSSSSSVYIKRLSDKIIAGYALIRDIHGNPALIVRVDQLRAVYKQSRDTFSYLFVALIIVAVFFTVAAVYFMDKFVSQRLAKLSLDVKEVAMARQFKKRVSASGSDELSYLASDINSMLTKLEELEKFKDEVNEARYRAVVEDQTELICRYLPNGEITFLNDACCRYFGVEKDRLIERKIMDIIPESIEAYKKRTALLSAEIPVRNRECTLQKDDGVHWLQWTDRAISDRNGSVVEFQSVGREITEVKLAEKALYQAVNFQNIILSISSSFINLSPDEIDSGINQALRSIGEQTGIDRIKLLLFASGTATIGDVHEWCADGIAPQAGEWVGRNIADFLPHYASSINNHEIIHIPDAEDLPPEQNHEKLFLAKHGIRSLLHVPIVFQETLVGYLCLDSIHKKQLWSAEIIDVLKIVSTIFVNAMERKRTEYLLRKTQKMEAIGTLAGGVAHDFNNILSAIIGQTEILLYRYRDAAITRRLEQILQACGRAKDLVSQILAFSHQQDEERSPIDITVIIKEALKLLRSSIPTTISIVSDIPAVRQVVVADPTQIHQILMNLCSNAAHAMREKGGILKVGLKRVDYDTEMRLSQKINIKPGSYVMLSVSDTGCGIDPAIIERIFDPFFTTKKVGEGTGLGLFVVYGIVKSHGGAIMVESEPAKGAVFNVYLPLAAEVPPAETAAEARLPLGKERVLFVDDEEILATVGQDLLQSLGYEVVSKTSSLEALDAVAAEPSRYDLVITDMTMPNMNGAELSRKIRQIRPDIPIIICTGYSELIDEKEAERLGIQRFLIKPLFLKNLAHELREVLDNYSGTRSTVMGC